MHLAMVVLAALMTCPPSLHAALGPAKNGYDGPTWCKDAGPSEQLGPD